MELRLNLCCQFIINKGQDCRLQIYLFIYYFFFFCNVSDLFCNENASLQTRREQIAKDF